MTRRQQTNQLVKFTLINALILALNVIAVGAISIFLAIGGSLS